MPERSDLNHHPSRGVRDSPLITGGFDYPENFIKYVDVFRRRYFRYDRLVAMLGRLFPDGPSGKKVLDVGCGTGSFALEMADAGYTVVGTDASEESIELARERAGGRPDVTFLVQDFRAPDLEGGFDLITVLHIPISLDAMRATLSRHKPHLKPDGRMAQLYLRKSANVLRDDKVDIDRHQDREEGFKVVRFNQWLLNDLHLDFISVVLIEDGGRLRLEFDKAKMELLPQDEHLHHEEFLEVHDLPTRNADSTPPWTEEYLQVLRHR